MKVRNDLPSVDAMALAASRTAPVKPEREMTSAEAPEDTLAVDLGRREKVAEMARRLEGGGQRLRDAQAADALVASLRESMQHSTQSPFDLQGMDKRGMVLSLLA